MNDDTVIEFPGLRVQTKVTKNKNHYVVIEPLMEFAVLDRKEVEQLRDALSKWLEDHKEQHDHDFSDGLHCSICGATLF